MLKTTSLLGTARFSLVSTQSHKFWPSWKLFFNTADNRKAKIIDTTRTLIKHRNEYYSPYCILYTGIPEIPLKINNLDILRSFGVLGIGIALQSFGNVAYCVDLTRESDPIRPTIPASSVFDTTQNSNTRRPMHNIPKPHNYNKNSDDSDNTPAIPPNIKKMALGGAMGFATGYFVKKASQLVAFSIGASFVLIQVLDANGYHIPFDLGRIEETYNVMLDLNRNDSDVDGAAIQRDVKELAWKVYDFFRKRFHTDAAFVVGFGIGLMYG
ncbi:6177_t:CDS:2 [Ambispora leptoticha]|uniref:6177_t:CDS:1 n=1 Tax=Ambispora leptoticha TaxID=144679 RepID=A0A9N8YVD4_9GLOM|nr:6177_t:CDS:2 [Ambispora leptoticha]